MNFTTFLVSSTNIFPLANSTAGGQLLSEWNLRSREMVSTPSSIKFDAGHSFTHCDDDYKVALDTGDTDGAITSTVLKIFPGRAIINGHFVENLAPMYVDILEANTELRNLSMAPLKGKLAIGIRAYYSTEATMAGSMEVEDDNNKYAGVQLVVLPEKELLTPLDVPTDEDSVTCHLKLATFTFRNGVIVESSITQNPNKTKYIDGGRLFNITEIMSDSYISKAGIHPNRLYVFAGKSTYNPATQDYEVSGKDTWCDATGSLMIWDSHVDLNNTTTDESELATEAVFNVDLTDDSIYLDIPHKQVDGMKSSTGDLLYYKDKILKLPKADYNSNTSGTVTPEYTKNVKKINARINDELHQLVKGKQRAYRETLSSQEVDSNDTTKLPKINPDWEVGDYVLVGQDYTVDNATTADAPSTIYAVIPGLITALTYIGYTEGSVEQWVEPDYSMPTGVELYDAQISEDLTSPTSVELSEMFPDYTAMRGIPKPANDGPVDYFAITYSPDSQSVKKYYYAVTSATAKEWSSTIFLTGTIPLADEDIIGGFYNISSGVTDAGYVYMDEEGHLRLVDYGLLRTGLLAYQLGEDLTFPKSLSLSEVQDYLDEYVNDRIAFPNSTQKENAAENNVPENVIHIYIDIADSETSVVEDEEETSEETTAQNAITIQNIDSRFGTCVYFHFTGTATSNTTINIVDCQKIRIDSTICGNTTSNTYEGGPIINLYRTNLYYDAAVLNYIISADRNTQPNGLNEEIIYEDGVVYTDFYPESFTGMVGLSLWYQQYESTDPQIVVDDKTVSELDVGYISESFEFWNQETAPNDIHYSLALSSISFDGTGVITKVGLLIADRSTNNVDPYGQHVFYGKFTLPQGVGLSYPQACIRKPLKITGSFVSAYKPDGGTDVIISNTNFTAETGVYDVANSNTTATGNIAILTNITSEPINVDFDTNLAPWRQNSYNLFYGGTVC